MKIVQNIDENNAFFHQNTLHQHIAVGDLSRADLSLFEPMDFGMYCVVLMDSDFGELIKNGHVTNYRAGTLFSLRPGQQVAMNLDYTKKPRGWMLAFRPELLEKSGLGRDFYMFDYFQQDVLDAIELQPSERGVILNCFANIYAELNTPTDYLSTHMLRLAIGQLLSYFKRFYERQYSDRLKKNTTLLEKLNMILDNYLSSGLPSQKGQPTVAWCASQFNLSPNYFGDLVKREIHITAQEFIQNKIIVAAKNLLGNSNLTINEISEELGFSYANHFTRMFTKREGLTPMQFRAKAKNINIALT